MVAQFQGKSFNVIPIENPCLEYSIFFYPADFLCHLEIDFSDNSKNQSMAVYQKKLSSAFGA